MLRVCYAMPSTETGYLLPGKFEGQFLEGKMDGMGLYYWPEVWAYARATRRLVLTYRVVSAYGIACDAYLPTRVLCDARTNGTGTAYTRIAPINACGIAHMHVLPLGNSAAIAGTF
eukprot:3595984-Rhodomonas_salina.1